MRWNDKQPIYLQLKDKMIAAIMDGSYAEASVIPSIRQMSAEYRINPLTVSKAYQALVEEGVLEKRRGLGMFVAKGAQHKLLNREKQRFLKDEWPDIKNRMRRLGIILEEIIK